MSKRKHDGEIDDCEPPVKKQKLDGEEQVQLQQDSQLDTITPEKMQITAPPNTSPDNEIEDQREISYEDSGLCNIDDDENEVLSKTRKDVEDLIAKQEDFQKKFLENLGSLVADFVDEMSSKFQEQANETEVLVSKVKEVVARNREKEEQFGKAKEYAEEIFQKLSIS